MLCLIWFRYNGMIAHCGMVVLALLSLTLSYLTASGNIRIGIAPWSRCQNMIINIRHVAADNFFVAELS